MRTAGTHQPSRQCAALVRANARDPVARSLVTPARTHKCSCPHALEASAPALARARRGTLLPQKRVWEARLSPA